MPKRKKRTVAKKRKDGDICDDETESESAKKVAAASSTSQCGDDGEEISSFTSVPLLRASEEGVKGSKTSHFMCNYCEFSAESKGELVAHMRKHMIKCTKCQFSSLSRKEVTQHCRDEHDVDFEATTHEVATSSTEVEMDKDPCSACVFCKFMTYSTEHLERHTSLKHPGMLPKSVAKMVTKLASTHIRQGDVRFYLSLAGKDNIDDNKLVSSSPPKTVSSEPIEIEDEQPADIKPKFEPLEQKVSSEILKKPKREASDMKSSAPDSFTQQLAKRMKQENMSVRSEADTSETERKPDRLVKVETIYCLTCPYSNVLIDKLKCHTLVQHPLGAAAATYSASESSLSDFTFFCVKEECPYSTGDLNEYQTHLMHCCSSVKSLKIIEKERFKSTVTFIFDLQKKHSLEEEKGFIEYAMSVLPHPHQTAQTTPEPVAPESQTQLPPLQPEVLSSEPPKESQSSVQQAKIQRPKVSDNKVHQQMQAVREINHPLSKNQVSADLQIVNNTLQQSPAIVTSAYENNGSRIQSNGSSVPRPENSSQGQEQPFSMPNQITNTYDNGNPQNKIAAGGQTQSQQEDSTSLPNFLDAGTASGSSESHIGFQRESQSVLHKVGALPMAASEQQMLQFPTNNPARPQQQFARKRGRGMQAFYQRNMPQNPNLPQPQTPAQGLPMPNLAPGRPIYRGRGRPPKMPALVDHNGPDDDVIVTAVVRMSPSNQRGRPPARGRARGRSPALGPQMVRAPTPNYGQPPNQTRGRGATPVTNRGQGRNLPRGRGAFVRPNFTPLPQYRPFDMSSHFEALACAANPDEEDDLQIVGMTPGKEGAFGNPKAVDASRFSFCCLHCGKDQGSKNVMKQHMKACHNDTLLGAFTNIDNGQWLYFCPQLNCAFMTYDELRLSDHLQKCCDPEKWKALDFGVAMNNLKSMKIRQMEVRNSSGSQCDPVDLDGQGMRDRFSTSLNDAFDDILVNTTGRQMVRPVGGRRPRGASSQRGHPQRMQTPYQPVNAMGRGRVSMPRPRQPMEHMVRSYSPRERLPMPRQAAMNYNTPGLPRPLNRRPAVLPPQYGARGMIPMQRPRMPHPVTPERPQPTTLQNPILIDVDPDSPEQPRSDSSNAFGNMNFAGRPAPHSRNSVSNQGQPYVGNNQGSQYCLEAQPTISEEQQISENQNPDQISSNFLSGPLNQFSDPNQLTLPTPTLEGSVTDMENSLSSRDTVQESSAPRTEQEAAPVFYEGENEPPLTNVSDPANLPENLSNVTSVSTSSGILQKTTATLVSNSTPTVTEVVANQGISAETEALNPELLSQCELESTDYHEEDEPHEFHTTDSSIEKYDNLETHHLQPQNTDVSKSSDEFISNAENELHDSHATPVQNENSEQRMEPMSDMPSSLAGDLFSSQPVPPTNMQVSSARINTNGAMSCDAEPLQPAESERQNVALTSHHSSPETQSLAPPSCMQSEPQAGEPLEPTTHKDMEESPADTQCLSSTVPIPCSSSLGGQAVSSAHPFVQNETSFEAPTNEQFEPSTEMHNTSSFNNQPTIASSLDEQSFLSTDPVTESSKNPQSALSTDMQSTIPSSQTQCESFSDTQSTSFTDGQSVLPSSEIQPAPSFDHPSLAPTTDMKAPVHTGEMQFAPSANNQCASLSSEVQPLEAESQPEAQSEMSTDVHNVVPSTGIQSVPSAEKSFPTDMQTEPLCNEQQHPPIENRLFDPSGDVESESSTNDQPVPNNNLQPSPVISTRPPDPPAYNDEQFIPATTQAVSSVDTQPQPPTIMEQYTSSTSVQPGHLNDSQSVSPVSTQAVDSQSTQAAPTISDPTQTTSQTLLLTCSTQPIPMGKPQHGPFENMQESPTPNIPQSAGQTYPQPGLQRPVENKTMNGQSNQWSSSELFDEEERINAVVLEKVFAKVPDMPKTLSRRLVFKFKQYANYKNVKITPDSKVIDEFVSKISYKRSGSADQKNAKSAQAAGNNASATMSTRSGKNLLESPPGREKTVLGSAISGKEIPSLDNTESQQLKHPQSTPLNRPCASQIQSNNLQEASINSTGEHNVQEANIDNAVEQPSRQSEQTHVSLTAHIGGNQISNSKPQSLSEETVSGSSMNEQSSEILPQTLQADTPFTGTSQNCQDSEDSAKQKTFLQPQTTDPSSAFSVANTAKEIPSPLQKETEHDNNLQNLVENSMFSPSKVSVEDTSAAAVKTSVELVQDVERENTSTSEISNTKDGENDSSSQNHSNESPIEHRDSESEQAIKENVSSEKDSPEEVGCNQTTTSRRDENNCEEDMTPSDQIANKDTVQPKHHVQEDGFSQVQSCEIVRGCKSPQENNPVSPTPDPQVCAVTVSSIHGRTTSDLDKDKNESQQQQASDKSAANECVKNGEKVMDSLDEAVATPDILETHVILPERSIHFSGVFAKLVQGLKQTLTSEVVEETSDPGSMNEKPQDNTISETRDDSKDAAASSEHARSSLDTTQSQNGSHSQDSTSSFKLDKVKLKQVLKRTMQVNGNSGPVYKKIKCDGRRASEPQLETQMEAAFARVPSPESNSCPAQPSLSVSQTSKEGICTELGEYQSFNQSDREELQAYPQHENTAIVNQNIPSESQPLSTTDKEDCPTIASLIAANLAAEREQRKSTSSPQQKSEWFLSEASCSKSESHETSGSQEASVPSLTADTSDTLPDSLPSVSKEAAGKPDLVDKATGRLILKVKKHSTPRFKAPKPSLSEGSTVDVQGTKDNLDEDHFVRRSLRERKVVHRDENEVTEMDELMSEDDDEYQIEDDSDCDSNGSWGDDTDQSHPKRIKRVKSIPDPSAFDFKTKGKFKCWLCRKIVSKCGFAKRHLLKKHPDKGLCAVDLGQSDFLGSPQLLLFCHRKCRYATLSVEGLKNHMINCEKEILCPLKVASSFVDTDYEELLKMGEKVLEVPAKKSRTLKKSQAKKSMSSEENAGGDIESDDVRKDNATENSSVLTQPAPAEPVEGISDTPETVSKADQPPEPNVAPHMPPAAVPRATPHMPPASELTATPHMPPASELTATPHMSPASEIYEVVDVDLDFPEPVHVAREPLQQQSSQPYSQFQHQQHVPIQQNTHQQQHQNFYTSHNHQASSPARPPQNFNTGHIASQPRHPALTSPRQVTTAAAYHQTNRSLPGPIPNSASPAQHRMPQRHPAPRQASVNLQPRGFQPNANTRQQQFHVRQRATLNPPDANLSAQRPRQQVPRFPQGMPVRGTRPANPRPRQPFVHPPQQQMQQQQRQPRQPAFAPQRGNNLRQPAGSQLRPRMMIPPGGRGRGSTGNHQQQPLRGAAVTGAGRSNAMPYPQQQQQRAPNSGVVRNRNPGPVNDQDGSYTITESGVICLD